jgi:replicative DNA helicase
MSVNEQIIKVEQLIMNLLLDHKDLVGEWHGGPLQPFHFKKEHRLLLFAIEESFKRNALLTRDAFYHFVKQRASNQGELNSQMFLYEKISILDADRDNFDLHKKQILDNYVSENAITYIEEFRKDLPKGGVEAISTLAKKVNNLAVDSAPEKMMVNYESVGTYAPEFFAEMEEKRNNKEESEVITCGIKEVDNTMIVGFAPGTMTLFCGDVASFKSTIMLNVGYNVWNQGEGYPVLFVPLEMPRNKMYVKFLSLATHINSEKIEHPSLLTPEQVEKIKKYTEKLQQPMKNHFYMMDTYERIPVSTLRREIEKNIDVFKPRLIVVDYTANLLPEAASKNSRPDIQIGEILKDLRTMGRPGALHEKGFGIVSAAQIGRDALKRLRKLGSGKTSFYSEDLRGSHELAADSDNIYAQVPDEAQPDSKLQFFVIKARYGRKTFEKNETKAVLEVEPEFSLVRSVKDDWLANDSEDIMSKVNDDSIDDDNLSFEEDKVETENLVADDDLLG